MKKNKSLFLLVLITFFGAVFRFYQLGANPPSLYWDEVAIGLDAYSVANTGKDINDYHWFQPMFGSYGDFKAPIYVWFASFAVKLFGLSEFSVRLPSAIFGTLLIPLIYFFVKELFKETQSKKIKPDLPLVSAMLVTISPWTFHFSRIGFESFLSLFWVVLSLLFFLKGTKKSGWYLILSSVFAVLALYSYFAIRVFLPLIFFFLGLISFKKIWQRKWLVLLALIIFGLSMIPLLASPYYEISQNYRLGNKNLVRNFHLVEKSSRFLERHNSSLPSKLSYHRYWFIGRDFLDHYFSHFSPKFLFFEGEWNLRHNTGFGGEFLVIFLPFLLIGFYLLIRSFEKSYIKQIWILILASPVAASLPYEIPNASRAIYLVLPLIIVIGLGIVWSFGKIKFNKIFFPILTLFILINFFLYFHDYLIHYPARSSKAWIYAYKQAGEYIAQNKDKYDFRSIDAGYWMPQLYVAYEMPESIEKIRDIKKAKLKDTPTSFGFPDIIEWLPQMSQVKTEDKPGVGFANPDFELIGINYPEIKRFYFLDGIPSLVLVYISEEE